MKLKLVVMDLELTRRQKMALSAGLGGALVLVAAVASADVQKVWQSGEVLTAADLNENFAQIDGRVTALEEPPSAVLAHKAASQPIAGGIGAVVTFGSEDFDPSNELDPATGTFTAARDGYYHVDCNISYSGSSPGCITLNVQLGDASQAAQAFNCGPMGAESMSVSAVVQLAAAETVGCVVENSNSVANMIVGGNQPWEATRNYISVVRVQ